MAKQILDMCCGSRMFWFDKEDSMAIFIDKRKESYVLSDGRELHINPDIIADFRQLPFHDNTFALVVFDPPHLKNAGEKGWMRKKYGVLDKGCWEDDIRKGFAESFRVLRKEGILLFKWNETQIPISKILPLSDKKPTVWQRTGKKDKTHWVVFINSL